MNEQPAGGVCDLADSYNGVSNTCPVDVLARTGTICRAASGLCDAADTCPGLSET